MRRVNQGAHRFRASLRGIADALVSVFFPAPCRLCRRILDNASRIPICRSCLASLEPESGLVCARCGRFLASPVIAEDNPRPLCHLCRRGLYDFDWARSYGAYTPAMARAIILLKYQEVASLGGWFAARLAEVAMQSPQVRAVDVVVPVPQHPSRLRERGYNQAELIARPLAQRLGLPCRPYLLVRERPRPDKLRLTVRERWRTVRGAYAVRQNAQVDNLRVLLVDDVFTTGATMDACSRTLRRAGASYVVGLSVARALPRGQGPSPVPQPEGPEEMER
jgi:ComF family protein